MRLKVYICLVFCGISVVTLCGSALNPTLLTFMEQRKKLYPCRAEYKRPEAYTGCSPWETARSYVKTWSQYCVGSCHPLLCGYFYTKYKCVSRRDP